MNQNIALQVRQELQLIKRKLYVLLKIEELSKESLTHLLKAYQELEKLSSTIVNPYE